jgi:DNA-directed RNA polymerase subunit RPC12/RpoP
MSEESGSFCENCGRQFATIDELEEGICNHCRASGIVIDKRGFHCWACERELETMHELAQGVCDSCKASILRKCFDLISDDSISQMISQILVRRLG